jgi:hypothetical protein
VGKEVFINIITHNIFMTTREPNGVGLRLKSLDISKPHITPRKSLARRLLESGRLARRESKPMVIARGTVKKSGDSSFTVHDIHASIPTSDTALDYGLVDKVAATIEVADREDIHMTHGMPKHDDTSLADPMTLRIAHSVNGVRSRPYSYVVSISVLPGDLTEEDRSKVSGIVRHVTAIVHQEKGIRRST